MKITLTIAEVRGTFNLPANAEIEVVSEPQTPARAPLVRLPPRAWEALKGGNRLAAIKEVRAAFPDCGLREAMDFVDSICPAGYKIAATDYRSS